MSYSFASIKHRSKSGDLPRVPSQLDPYPIWKAQCDEVIRLVEDKGLVIAGMITIHPYQSCGFELINLLSTAVDWAVLDTFDPSGRQRQHMVAPVLTAVEKNHEDSKQPDGFHLHKIFCHLPVERVIDKKVLTYSVGQSIKRVYKGVYKESAERVYQKHLSDHTFHLNLYKDAMHHPPRLERHSRTTYRPLPLLPNGGSGHYITPVDPTRSYKGLSGWRGLIAYATKQCAYGDPTSVIDYECHSRLIGYTPADLNSGGEVNTLERFFEGGEDAND